MQISSTLHASVDHDLTSGNSIRSSLVSRKAIPTRLHAELQIASRFSRDKHGLFVDGDRYIGCGKPACYYCYDWICFLRHLYVPPATHHRIIPCCRGPDNDINEAGVAVPEDMYKKSCGGLNQDILDLLSIEIARKHTA